MSGLKSVAARCTMNASKVYAAYTSKCFRCVNIFSICILSGWNPVFTESYAANSSSLHPSILPRDACYPEVEDEAKRQSETMHFMYSCRTCIRIRVWGVCGYTCVYTCIHARTCVAFAPVILNVREDISILVGKHTNSNRIRPFAYIVCTHARAAA